MAQYGLIGEKLGHSFSKLIHNQIADYQYDLLELTRDDLEAFMAEKKFSAVNVTIPYKQEVIPYLDDMSISAKTIGAVNCVRNDNGKLIGHNTDFDGLVELIKYLEIDIANKWVLILGTGGTADTANAVCDSLGANRVIKVGRNRKDDCIIYDEAVMNCKACEIIINATPCGMYPDVDSQAIDLSHFPNLEGVIDVVYNPLNSKLVMQALSLGVKAGGGLYMLVAQAVKASEFFLDAKYEEGLIEEIYRNICKDKTNIVLTGMPASGKTTIGKLLAKKLGREFVDTDELIEKKAGTKIVNIFENHGEDYFRNLETEVIKGASKLGGVVIATGGGAILRNENINALKQNGKIFFLDRNVEALMPTDSRPTASNKEAIMKRFEERYSIYKSTADFEISNNATLEDAVQKILEVF